MTNIAGADTLNNILFHRSYTGTSRSLVTNCASAGERSWNATAPDTIPNRMARSPVMIGLTLILARGILTMLVPCL